MSNTDIVKKCINNASAIASSYDYTEFGENYSEFKVIIFNALITLEAGALNAKTK